MQSSRGSLTFQGLTASRALLFIASCILLVNCFAYSLIPKIETVCSSETSVNFYQSTLCHIPETSHHLENLRPDRNISCFHHVKNGYKVHIVSSPVAAGNWPLTSTYCHKVENLLNLASTPPIHLHGVAQCCLY
jgi:hypothetical protein